MSKPSAKNKERRRKKQRKREDHAKAYKARKGAFRTFPEIVYETTGAPEPLVRNVKEAVSKVVAEHERLMDPDLAGIFHLFRVHGFREFRKLAQEYEMSRATKPMPQFTWTELELVHDLGDLILSHLADTVRTRYFPSHFFHLLPGQPTDRQILVKFEWMQQRKTDGGTVFYTTNRMPVVFGDELKTAAFTRHALERICERTASDQKTYGGLGKAFATCSRRLCVAACTLRGNQTAFSLFHPLIEGLEARFFAEEIRGNYEPGQEYFSRVGYCPVAFCGDLAIAKTLLLPGMKATPEFEHFARSREEREAIIKEVENLTFRRLIEHKDFSLIKRFHEDGIPQVLTADELLGGILGDVLCD